MSWFRRVFTSRQNSEARIRNIERLVYVMAAELDELQAMVTKLTASVDAAVAVIDAPPVAGTPGIDPAAVASLAAAVGAQADRLNDAVAKATPPAPAAAPAPAAPAPTPAASA